MAKLIDEAKAYEPQKTKNIADLQEVPVDLELESREGADKDGKEFKYNVVVLNNEEYRVPNSVLQAIKNIVSEKPDLQRVKVVRTGEGLNTTYTVVPLM